VPVAAAAAPHHDDDDDSPRRHETSLSAADADACHKCQDMVRGELLDAITSENALVCKHHSAQNISMANPGLLIVERETARDAHSAALTPHLAASHLHRPGSMSHQRAKELKFCEDRRRQKSRKKRTTAQSGGKRGSVHEASGYCAGRPLSSSREFVLPGLLPSRPLSRHSQLASAERLKNHQHLSNSSAAAAGHRSTSQKSLDDEYDYDARHGRGRRAHFEDEEEPEDEEATYRHEEEEEFFAASSSRDVREIPIGHGDASSGANLLSEETASRARTVQYEEQISYDKFYSKSNIVNRSWSNRNA
jgi:hypothetical protein